MGQICSLCDSNDCFRKPTIRRTDWSNCTNLEFVLKSHIPAKRLEEYESSLLSLLKLKKYSVFPEILKWSLSTRSKFSLSNSLLREIVLKFLEIDTTEDIVAFEPCKLSQENSSLAGYPFLNQEGKREQARIRKMLQLNHSRLEFSSDIDSVISILLLIMSPSEVYATAHQLILSSENNKNWHFAITSHNNEDYVRFLSNLIKEKAQNLTIKNSDLQTLLKTLIPKLFSEVFSLHLTIRLVFCFILVGDTLVTRLLVSIFCFLAGDLTDLKQAEEIIKKKSMVNFSEIFEYAYKLSVPAAPHRSPLKDDHWPGFKSNLLSQQEMKLIWDNFHPVLQLCTPQLVFSTQTHGATLRAMYQQASQFPHNTSAMVLLRTKCGSLLGAVLDCNLRVSKKYVGGCDSFVFQIHPQVKFSYASGVNHMYAYPSPDLLVFGGGGQGPAFTIDKDLLHCMSFSSETFMNIPDRDHYLITDCELILLVP